MVTGLSPVCYARKESRLGIICFRGSPQNYRIVINAIVVALLICLLFGSPEYTLWVHIDLCTRTDVCMRCVRGSPG